VILDLFAGMGGWDEALRQLGETSVGIEWDETACKTRYAADHLTIQADVSQYDPHALADVEGLIASPPCPTFSTAGNGEGVDEMIHLLTFAHSVASDGWSDPTLFHYWSDPRTPLVLEPLRWTLALKPKWIALEQVPAVRPLWDEYVRIFRGRGYSAWAGVLDAECFGVPQARDRAILMAHRDRIVHPPVPTHQRYVPGEPQWSEPQTDIFGHTVLPWVSMADALGFGDGRVLRRTQGTGIAERHGDRPDREISEPAYTLTSKGRSDVWVVDRRTNSRGPGGTLAAAVPVPMDRPGPTLTGKSGAQWVLRSPATTVCGDPRLTARNHHVKGSQGRTPKTTSQVLAGDYDGTEPIKLTIEEGLILQSFDPSYPVQGTKSKKWEQIGNAIPPLLAKAILGALV
jgi:DNA (cytosine-5)-methyltransferase 1